MNSGQEERKVLFVCAENAGRSQMAEAFFNFLAEREGNPWRAESSGTFPAERIHPEVVEVMGEKGLDLSSAKPKKFHPEKIGEYDRVISFGCLVKSAFPKEIQERIEDWPTADPGGQPLSDVRRIRDVIEERVQELFRSLD